MRIEKRYIDSFKPSKPNPPADQTFRSFDDIRNEYINRGERKEWIDAFISTLKQQGKATDRFAEYRIIHEVGDTVTVLPDIFTV